MNNALKTHIKKLQNRSILSLISFILIFISIIFGISFISTNFFISIIFLGILLVCITYLILLNKNIKKEEKANYKPIIFKSQNNISFESLKNKFELLANGENILSTSKDLYFYRFKKILKLRIILYKTINFNKKDYDIAKDKINKKVNKTLKISHWVTNSEALNMMRLNIIYTNSLNDELYQFISQNTLKNLTRVEGIINIVIVNNQILLPPLYGDCVLSEIKRYKNIINFIEKVLLEK